MSLLLRFLGAPPAEPDFILQLDAPHQDVELLFDSGLFESALLEIDVAVPTGSVVSLEVIFDPPKPLGLSLVQPTPPDDPPAPADIPFFLESFPVLEDDTPEGLWEAFFAEDDALPLQALDIFDEDQPVITEGDIAQLFLPDVEDPLIFPHLDDPFLVQEEGLDLIEPGLIEAAAPLDLTEIPPPLEDRFEEELFYDASGLVEPTQFVDIPTPPRRNKGHVIRVWPQRGRFEIRIR